MDRKEYKKKLEKIMSSYLNGYSLQSQSDIYGIPYSTLYKELKVNYNLKEAQNIRKNIQFNEKIKSIQSIGSDVKYRIEDKTTLSFEDWKGVKSRYYFLCIICKNNWKYVTFDQILHSKTCMCNDCSRQCVAECNKIPFEEILLEVESVDSEIRKDVEISMDESMWGRVVDKYWFKCNKCKEWCFVEYRRFVRKQSGTCRNCRGLNTDWNIEAVKSFCENLNSKFLSEEWNISDEKYKFKCTNCEEVIIKTFTKFKSGQNLCKKCISSHMSKQFTMSHQEYLNRLQKINSKVKPLEEYKGYNEPILHICPICLNEEWSPTPSNILDHNIQGCMGCRSSTGEDRIKSFLKINNIKFKTEYKFPDLVSDKNYHLRFDFYILNNNKITLIEFDGQHHYEIINYSKDEIKNINNFKQQQKNDRLKNEYCKNNNLKLIRIPYWELDNMEKILKEEIMGDKYE